MTIDAFLKDFVPKVANNLCQLSDAVWLLETTNAPEAADLTTRLMKEMQALYEDPVTYLNLQKWNSNDPFVMRQITMLRRSFKQGQVPKEITDEIARVESELSQTYGSFRPEVDGKLLNENEILEILKTEIDPVRRRQVWEASKYIGDAMASRILEIVEWRNKAARSIGYDDFYQMKLDLNEINEKWLYEILDDFVARSEVSYGALIAGIEQQQMKKFGVRKEDLGPWAWSDPFGQVDPFEQGLDNLLAGVNIIEESQKFFSEIGFDLQAVLEKSDLYERPNKNQHAFCINMDRGKDVRILTNIKPTIYWLEGVLHELGHVVYYLGIDQKLPWLLRDTANGITSEAVALLFGRLAYSEKFLKRLTDKDVSSAPVTLKRRQHLLCRFVVMLCHFERELYRNPHQDLNKLWWQLVEKFQKIRAPKEREGKNDWAAKYHIGLSPVYAHNYILGEFLASSLEVAAGDFPSITASKFLGEKLFYPGDTMEWMELIKKVTGKTLSSEMWLRQFG